MPEADAVAALLAGQVTLAPFQPDPPFMVLEAITGRVATVEVFGPQGNDLDAITKIENGVIHNGIRQDMVLGKPLAWFGSKGKVRDQAKQALTGAEASGTCLIRQLEAVLQSNVQDHSQVVSLAGKRSPEQLAEAFLVQGTSGNMSSGTWNYHRLEPRWFEFHEKLQCLSSQIDELVSTALTEGRILCVEDLDHGSRMVHPQNANRYRPKRSKSSLVYCFTRNLPQEWFLVARAPHAQRNEATEWMKRCYGYFESQGRRAGAKQLQNAAIGKFGMAEDAAKRAWNIARVDLTIKLGNIPLKERVSDKEINEIN